MSAPPKEWNRELQHLILAGYLRGDLFTKTPLDPDVFRGRVKGPQLGPEQMAEILVSFFETYNRPPSTEEVRQKIAEGNRTPERAEAMDGLLADVLAVELPADTAYLVDEVRGQMDIRRFDNGMREAGRLIDNGQIDEAREIMAKALEPIGDADEADLPVEISTLRLPAVSMIGLAREFAELYGSVMETPRAFLFMGFLTHIGASVAQKITLDTEIKPQPRLYVVLIGPSADTRKSTAMITANGFFKSLGPDVWEVGLLYGVGSAEGLAMKMAETGSVLLEFDELKQFVDKAKAEGSVALPMVNILFEGTDYDNPTKKNPISLRNVALSLLSACTTETYATIFSSAFTDIGFLNRLFIVVERTDKKIAIPGNAPPDQVDELRDRTRDLLRRVNQAYIENQRRPIRLKIDYDAKRLYDKWYAKRKGTIFEKRLDAYAMRFMLLLALTTADPATPIADIRIDRRVVRAALALVHYELQARREHDPVDAENIVARCEETIRRAVATTGRSKRDLKKKCHVERIGLWAYEQAERGLLAAGEIRFNPASKLFERGRGVPTSVPKTFRG